MVKRVKNLQKIVLTALLIFVCAHTSYGGGLTIITHGYSPGGASDEGWIDNCVGTIPWRFGENTSTVLTMEDYLFDDQFARGGNIRHSVSYSWTPGPLSLDQTANGEVILKINWSQLANNDNWASSSSNIAVAVVSYLLTQHPEFLQQPIHLIGHSRGGSVVSEISRLLGTYGIWVDQQTTLDPHPVNADNNAYTGNDPLSGNDWAFNLTTPGIITDAPVRAYENTVFADNYWENTSAGILVTYPAGQTVSGSLNLNLNTRFDVDGLPIILAWDDHSRVHDWYYGTIDLSASVVPGTSDSIPRSSWYISNEGSGANTGFYYSRIVGGQRPSSGLALYAGSASRTAVQRNTATGSQWPNVANLRIADSRFDTQTVPQFQIGETLGVSFVYQSYGNAATTTLFLDSDRNPYNGNSISILGYQIGCSANGSSITTKTAQWSTANRSSGYYYLYAKIEDGFGHVRYAYAPKKIQLVTAIPQQGSDLYISTYDWNADTEGDEDGVLETGEDVALGIRLGSSASVSSVMATLSSSLSSLNISDNEEQYPSITAGTTAWAYGEFNMYLNMNSTVSVPFALHVEYTKNGQDYYQDFTFNRTFYQNGSREAAFDIVSYTIDDSIARAAYNNGDGIIQSGERVEIRPRLKNTGLAGATDIDAWLIYTGTVFSVNGISDIEGYPDLSSGAEDYPLFSSTYGIRNIPRNFTGTEFIDFHLTYYQSPTEVVLPDAIQIDIQPAAWMRLSEDVFDFGVAVPGSNVTHTVLVQNTGSASLQITNVTTSASDTTWTGFTLPCTVAAGQSTSLVVQINTTGMQGQVSRQVQIYSTGRVGQPGEDDVLIMSGLASASVPVSVLPGGTGAYKPDISGHKIVWYDSSSGNPDIYCFDVDSGVKLQITTNTANQYDPFISGNLIIWEDNQNKTTNDNSDVYAYDLNHPEFGVFPVANANPAEERILGISGNLVAVRRVYEVLYSDSSPEKVWNLIVLEYDGNGGFTQRYSSNYTPGSGTANRETILSDGDFAEGFLLYNRQTLYMYTSKTGRRSWQQLNSYTHVIDFAAGDTGPRTLAYINLWPTCASAHRFVYVKWSSNNDDELWMWKTDGSNQRIYGIPNEDVGADVVAIGGSDGQDVICFNYNGRNGLYYIDRSKGNEEAAITTDGYCDELRSDGFGFVWVDNDTIKYAFLKQPDVQVTAPGIVFSSENPMEGSGVNVSVLVRNLTSYNQTGTVTVCLYDGDPDSGGVSLATSQNFTGLSSNTDRSVTFSNITSLIEGQHTIFAKLTVSASDPASNNKASRILTVQDSDTSPPVILNFLAAERGGDGDGVIGSDENIRVSWNLVDASGIGLTAISVDGTNQTVQGSYYADLGPLAVGTHSVTVTATDADFSPESRESNFTFSVVPCEAVVVSYGASLISNGALVNLGIFSRDVPPAPVSFAVQNNGAQRLTLNSLTVGAPFGKHDPVTTNIPSGGYTIFDIIPDSSADGSFTGTVALASSDPLRPLVTFQARYDVLVDTDGDTIPDAWELLYFPGLQYANATSDSDGDGVSDKDEYLRGTDPTVAQYRLVAASIYGGAVPPVGTNWYDNGMLVQPHVTNSPIISGTTQYLCKGWSGTGSVPSSGAGTNTGPFTVTNNSSIAWLWTTNVFLDTATNGNGSVNMPDVWWPKGSNAQITATPSAHYHFTGWTGQTNGCTISSNVITAPMTTPRTITANFVVDQHSLIVTTPYGKASPTGTTTNNWGSSISAAITNSPVLNGTTTQYVCSGWSGTGSVPPSGTGTNTGLFMLTNNSSIAWLWTTNYWLTMSTNGNGSVSVSNIWWPKGSNVQITATAADHYRFTGWTGQTNGCTISSNQITALMTMPRQITANFIRQYSLVVSTLYGEGNPPSGTNRFDGSVTARMTNSPVTVGTTQYVCRGWVGTGNVPASGTTTSAGPFTITSDSTIIWLWKTNFWLDASYTGSGKLSTGDCWVARGSNLLITATSSNHWHFGSWSGDTNGCAIASNKITVAMDRSRAVAASFEIDRHKLIVTTPYGQANPPAGTNWFDYGSSNNVTVTNSPVITGGTQYVCKGWTRTGSVPASGTTTNTGLFALTNDCSVVWLWTTNYWLHVDMTGHGSVSTSDVWIAKGTNILVTAVPGSYCSFGGWQGQTNGCTIVSNKITAAMTMARSIGVVFIAEMATNAVPKWWLAQHNLTNFNTDAMGDVDLDGQKTWQEYIAGCDPTNKESFFRITKCDRDMIGWDGASGRVYSVYWTTNLMNGFPPQPLASNIPWTQASFTNSTTAPGGFYKINVRME